MADKIKVDTEQLDQISQQFSRLYSELNSLGADIASAQAEVRRVASGHPQIFSAIGKARIRSNAAANRARRMSNAVRQASSRWQEAERRITSRQITASNAEENNTAGEGLFGIRIGLSTSFASIFNRIWDIFTNKPGVNEKVFDGKGKYGGNQSDAKRDKANYDKYRDLVEKNTGRRLSDEELEIYLSGMANEGCGYMAIVNVILKQYEGRPTDFERTFGFPMYDPTTGDLNYNTLMVDLYSSTDNHNNVNGKDAYNQYEDFGDNDSREGYDPFMDPNRKGLNQDTTKYRMELYMADHGVDGHVEVKTKNQITVNNYEQYAKNGQVILNTGRPLTMRDENGEILQKDNVGHSMTVTGVETIEIDGKDTTVYKVSSWGETYYINPGDEHGYLNFDYVTFG